MATLAVAISLRKNAFSLRYWNVCPWVGPVTPGSRFPIVPSNANSPQPIRAVGLKFAGISGAWKSSVSTGSGVNMKLNNHTIVRSTQLVLRYQN